MSKSGQNHGQKFGTDGGRDNGKVCSTLFASVTLSNMGIRGGICTSTVFEGLTSVFCRRLEGNKTPAVCWSLAGRTSTQKQWGHVCVKAGRQRKQNAWLSDSSLHSSSVSSGHNLDAWKHTEILAQGKKMTRNWPKKGMFNEYFCPVYQAEPSAFPNRVFSFHASIFCITWTKKTTENVLQGSTVYCSRETIHFSGFDFYQSPSGLHGQPVPVTMSMRN